MGYMPRKLQVSPAKTSLRRRKKPLVTAAPATKTDSGVAASVTRSIRRFFKIFSKLLVTTKSKPSDKKVTISGKQHPTSAARRHSLPPLKTPDQKTVFLDLDDTLIHAVPATLTRPKNYDFAVRFLLDGQVFHFYVLKRPFVDEFLRFLTERGFEIVVFTASMKDYANMVLDRLDRKGLISHRLYRDSCKVYKGKLVKDLSGLGRDLKRVIIVDDNPNHYCLQPENGIRIKPFSDDLRDDELKKLMKKMMKLKVF